jgi:hypothetical protein
MRGAIIDPVEMRRFQREFRHLRNIDQQVLDRHVPPVGGAL